MAGPGRSDDELLGLVSEWRRRQKMVKDDEEAHVVPEAGLQLSGGGLDDLVERLEGVLPGPLSVGDHRQRLIRRIAAEVFLSEVRVSTQTRNPDKVVVAAQPGGNGSRNAEPSSSLSFHSSSPLEPSQDVPPISGSQTLPVKAGEAEEEDPVSCRIRQYASMKPVKAGQTFRAMVISHWELGADVNSVDWKPGLPPVADEEDDRRKRKRYATRRKAERRAASGLSDGVAKSESQSMPTIIASQPRESLPTIQSSQPPGISSQAMSQIVPGQFGSRRQEEAKKEGRSGFR